MDTGNLDSKLWEPLERKHQGDVLSLVLKCKDVEGHWLNPLTGQIFLIEDVMVVGAVCAFHQWKVDRVSQAGVVRLVMTNDSQCLNYEDAPQGPFKACIELCAGLGGTSFGCMQAGICPLLGIDHKELAGAALRRNAFPEVLIDDVGNPLLAKKIHECLGPIKCGLIAGFPCQPFAGLGNHRGFSDQRSAVFFRILDVSWLIQSSFILMECVKGAGTQKIVRDTLDRYCAARDFHWSAVVLHLERTWPCRRARWWAFLCPREHPLPDWEDLPENVTRMKVKDLIPDWPLWPKSEELQLALTEVEKGYFHDELYGNTNRYLDVAGPCPTLMHSMGYQVLDCPCNCRGPLGEHLLQTQGLHGVLVCSGWSDVHERHLHPKEACLLVGIPGDWVCHETDVRQDLPLIGQVASPIQSHWMMIQAFKDPAQSLEHLRTRHEKFVEHIRRSHQTCWPTPFMYVPRILEILDDETTQVRQIVLGQPSTVKDFKSAEEALALEPFRKDVFGPNLMLRDTDLLPIGKIWLQSRLVGHGPFDAVPAHFSRDGLDDLTMWQEGCALLKKKNLTLDGFWSPRQLTMLVEADRRTNSVVMEIKMGMKSGPQRGFFWHKQHWFYFVLEVKEGKVVAQIFDGLDGSIPSDFENLVFLFAMAADLFEYEVIKKQFVRQSAGNHCGTIALLHMGMEIGLWEVADEGTAQVWFEVLLHRQRFYGRGPNEEAAVEMLNDLLLSKGVKAADVESRSKAAIRKLGLRSVEDALRSKDPWRSLKELGNQQSRPFQFVQYSELQAHVRSRTESKKHADGRIRKTIKHKKAAAHINLTPEEIELMPGSFLDQEDDEVPVITKPEVSADARGIALVSLEFAAELATHSHNLSVDALAVVTLGAMSGVKEEDSPTIQFPGVFLPTKEPILITGTLLQLGDVKIHRKPLDGAPQVAALDTEVIRLQAFRDLFGEAWAILLKGPLKHIIAVLPGLQYCDGKECLKGCAKFHAAIEEEVSTAILDAWGWKWSTVEGKVCKQNVAELFSIYVRIPSSGLTSLLQTSGWNGIFVEPRLDGQQGAHTAYKVIWLHRSATLDEALKFKREQEMVIGLARMQNKFGLRVQNKDESAMLRIVYPNANMVACEVTMVFEVGPLPFGMSKDKIAELLVAWQWKARPLRPLRSTFAGKYWEIGAAQDPKAPVMPTDQGEVTITLRSQAHSGNKTGRPFHASAKTQAAMKLKPGSSSSQADDKGRDAWAYGEDPWAAAAWKNYKPSTAFKEPVFAPSKQKTTEAKTRFGQLQEEVNGLKVQLEQKSADVDMEEHERKGNMETEITELKAQAAKFDKWFAGTGHRMDNMEGKLRQQGQQLTELTEAVQQQGAASQAIQTQVTDLQISMREEIGLSFNKQMTEIAALLEKRQKTG